MINIIPESARSSAVREYRLRLAAVGLFVLGVLSICSALMLSPAYFFAKLEKDNAVQEEARLSQADGARAQGEGAMLMRAAAEAKLLFSLFSAPPKSERTQAVLSAAGSGITITRVSFSDTDSVLQISGTAATREALLAFSRRLTQIPGVAAADVPVSDLAKNTDIRFNMNATLAK